MTEFEKQKQDAIERVKRMNQSYKNKIAGNKVVPAVKNQSTPIDIMKLIRFDSVKNDPDRLLLLGVLLLLSGEKTDEKLMYALLYIMI